MRRACLIPTLCLAFAVTTFASSEINRTQWPQFLGPNGQPTAFEQTVPTTFGPDENLLWRIDLPSGHSSPCIWGNHLFLSAYEGKNLIMLAIDRRDGSLLWKQNVQAKSETDFIHRAACPAQSTPCTDGELVYFYFGSYGLVALDFDGKLAWEKRLSSPRSKFGAGTSTILYGDSSLINRDDTDDPCILSLNSKTGETRWKHPRFGYRTNQSTPFVWNNRLRTELVFAGTRSLVSLNPDSGELLWKVEDTCALPCSSPTGNNDMLFFASWTASHVGGQDKLQAHFHDDIGFTQDEMEKPEAFFARFDADKDNRITREELPQSRARDVFKWIDRNRDDSWDQDEFKILLRPAGDGRNIMVAVKAGGNGLLNDTTFVAWERSKHLPYVATPLLSGDRVYLVKSLGVITCLNTSTGIPYFEGERTGVKGEYYASPIKIGNRIFLTSSLGTVIVIRDSESFEILAKNILEEETFATPAVADNTLYIRSASSLWAFGS